MNSPELINLFEYDLKSDNKISFGKFYWVEDLSDYLRYKRTKQMKSLIESDKDLNNYLDFFSVSCPIYYFSQLKTEKLEVLYHFSNFFDQKNISLDIFPKLNLIDHFHIKCLEQNLKLFFLYYVGFDLNDSLSKIGFLTDKKNLFDLDFKYYYKSYGKINEVINFISVYNYEYETDFLSLQYSPKNTKFFGIEISIKYEKLFELFTNLFNANLIDKKEYLNFKSISNSYKNNIKDSDISIIKFRWENEENLTIKLYIQKQLHFDKFF